jgi:PAS domain S-box-containing protein
MDDAPFPFDGGDYLRSTSDAIPALIAFFDAQHICRYANDHHLLWYGRPPQELIGLHMREFLGEEAYATRRQHLEKVAQGEQASFETAVPHRQSGWREAAIRYVPRFGAQGFEGFHTLVFDLSREKHRYHSVFDGAAMGFWEIDLANLHASLARLADSGTDIREHIALDPHYIRHVLHITPVLDMNQKACSMLAVDRETAVGRPLDEWCPDEGLGAWKENLIAYLSDADSYETETVIRREDGALIDVLLSCAFPKRRGDQTLVVVGMVDISARVAKEKELARTQADLAHAARVATLGELMASIAHEVSQPLAAVVANANASLRWLDRSEPDAEEAKAALRRIMREASRASEIIVRARQLAMKGTPTRTAFDVNRMIEESIDITRRQASALGSSLTTRLMPGLPPLVADRIQIQQVIINLVVNAAQAMAGQNGPRAIELSTAQDGDEIVLEVRDTGPGLGTHADSIFDAFFTTKTDGMGMGLSVAKSIIGAHGGKIDAGPGDMGGTIFRIIIPIGSPKCEHS